MTLHLATYPPVIDLAPWAGAQVAYALVTIGAEGSVGPAPLNWVVVADASRSMRIPIVSEEQFRDLVRDGGAHEVLVDGLPVWQLAGPVPEAVRAVAPSALDHTARALHNVVERLERDDRLCLVACAERAMRLASGSGAWRDDLVAGIAALRAAQLGEETDLAAGMRLALEELGPMARGGRILLLTDGFTRDPEACIALARVAAARGVSVSTLGLGGEFQDDLLTRLADLTGGRATFVRRAEQIPPAVSAELDAARGAVARTLTLEIRLTRSVTLRHATRLAPDLAPLEWESDPDARSIRLPLGDLERGAAVRLLLEFLAPPAPHPPAGGARMRLAALTARAGTTRASADVLGRYAGAAAPDPLVLAGAGRASIARLQRRAAAAVASGDAAGAARLLRAVADRFRDLGERELAQAALREAEALAATGRDSGPGARELTYATRRLG